METKTYTVPISNIDSIQLNLFDFIPEGISKNEYIESKIEERINSKPDFDVDNSKWALNDYNTFSYVNPVCPKCGSKKINKKGSVKRNKQGIDRMSLIIDYKLMNVKNANIGSQPSLIS